MEAERMAFLHTALDQEKFDTEREVVKNERRQVMENVPYGLADETIGAHVYPAGHPYQWSVIGSMEDLNRASLDDLRQFFFEFYHPGNCTLTLVGSFDPAAARQWIESYFGAIPAGETIAPAAKPTVSANSRRIIQRDRVQFPRVYWSWPTVPETHADAPALDLLADILADGDASRLYRALVVDDRLASDINASNSGREIAGVFTIDATAAPQRTVEEIENVISMQLDAMAQAALAQPKWNGPEPNTKLRRCGASPLPPVEPLPLPAAWPNTATHTTIKNNSANSPNSNRKIFSEWRPST